MIITKKPELLNHIDKKIETLINQSKKEDILKPNSIFGLIEQFNLTFPFTVKRVKNSSNDANFDYTVNQYYVITDVEKILLTDETNSNVFFDWVTNVVFSDNNRMDAVDYKDYIWIKNE